MSDFFEDAPDEGARRLGELGAESANLLGAAFGLSPVEFAALVREMSAMVRRVGCPRHIDPLDVVHDAFVVALCKPISERPAVDDQKRFVGWMCALAKASALTNRKSKHRRLLSAPTDEEQLDALAAACGVADRVVAREAVRKALAVLAPHDLALIAALYVDGKTINEVAREQNRRWTTVKSHKLRVLAALRAAIQAVLAALVLLLPKEARAQMARWKNRAAHLRTPFVHLTCALSVTVASGVVILAGSSAATMPSAAPPMALRKGLAAFAVEVTENSRPNPPPPALFAEEIPVKPSDIDTPAPEWSASGMSSSKSVNHLLRTMFPAAFLLLPAVTQVACAGAGQRPPVAAPPEESAEEEAEDLEREREWNYQSMCDSERRRGNDCISREEWEKK